LTSLLQSVTQQTSIKTIWSCFSQLSLFIPRPSQCSSKLSYFFKLTTVAKNKKIPAKLIVEAKKAISALKTLSPDGKSKEKNGVKKQVFLY
jgi:hypothetical protein